FLTSRCKSKQQLDSDFDENLRIEVDTLKLRELPPEKYIQLFNIPPACNGAVLKGLKKTIIVLTILEKGKHVLSIIPQPSAAIEDISVRELGGREDVYLTIEEQAEDGNRRPWYTIVLLDLPLMTFSLEASVSRRLRDSDDVKILIDGTIQKRRDYGKYVQWYFAGGLLKWIVHGLVGASKREKINFSVNLDHGIHYVELFADRKPFLHGMSLNLAYHETESAKRATNLIGTYRAAIMVAAQEFGVDPVMVGAVIYQEQATNVDFIDHLTDYIGGLLHLNTSIGIGQVRVITAQELEKIYPQLGEGVDSLEGIQKTFITVERLKDPWTNIRYVAAKLRFSIARWARDGYDIESRHDILGTLYNIEDIRDAKEPHDSPKSNEFGIGVQRNYDKVKKLLGL
ncbi:DUF1402 family protein, partial [Candidatus Uhrbacteria bacterium]|nr:DUF1402 family protein [Candidatus Uhrbacteria bacterium]